MSTQVRVSRVTYNSTSQKLQKKSISLSGRITSPGCRKYWKLLHVDEVAEYPSMQFHLSHGLPERNSTDGSSVVISSDSYLPWVHNHINVFILYSKSDCTSTVAISRCDMTKGADCAHCEYYSFNASSLQCGICSVVSPTRHCNRLLHLLRPAGQSVWSVSYVIDLSRSTSFHECRTLDSKAT